jgi:hypothetical protein
LDALVVALHGTTEFCRHLKYEKSVYLITDAESSINKDGFEVILSSYQEKQVHVFVV